MVVCTFEIWVTFPRSQLHTLQNGSMHGPCSASYPSGNLVDGSPLVANSLMIFDDSPKTSPCPKGLRHRTDFPYIP